MALTLPRIIYQTSPRWFVISKPAGWQLTRRGAQPCVTDVLPALLGDHINHIRFPIDIDSRYYGLAVVTTDSGMQSQFERFRLRNSIKFWYKLTVSGDPPASSGEEEFVIHSINYNPDDDTSEVEICSDYYLRYTNIQSACKSRILDGSVIYQHRLVFPDPTGSKPDVVDVNLLSY